MSTSPLPFDVSGSTLVNGHTIPLGATVVVTRGGVAQPWGVVTVVRHERNRTYRLRFENDTFVTAHESELEVIS